MAAGDKKPPEESDDESPAPPKPDVRVTSHDDMGVHVSRNLRAEGPSARGWNSNMSKLSFSARALPRDEGAAEQPAPAQPAPAQPAPAQPAPAQPASAPEAAAPVTPPAAGASSSAAPDSPADPGSPLSWLTGLFSRR
jgi:hypothetical protein